MAQDDYQLLEEYTEWQEEKLLHEVDASVEAFKAEREAEVNEYRVAKAIAILADAIEIMSLHGGHGNQGDEVDCPTVEYLKIALDSLSSEREYEEVHILTSTDVKRVYS